MVKIRSKITMRFGCVIRDGASVPEDKFEAAIATVRQEEQQNHDNRRPSKFIVLADNILRAQWS